MDLLLGADVYVAIIEAGRTSETHNPENHFRLDSVGHCRFTDGNSLCAYFVRQFWQQEDPPVAAPPLIPQDQECENFFF